MTSYGWLRYQWHRVLAVGAAVAGVVLLIVGWSGVSGSSLTTEQLPYIASGAVGGLFALGLAATLWLSADLREEFTKLDEIYEYLTGQQHEQEADDGELLAGGAEAEQEYVPAAPRRRPLRARPPTHSEP